MEPGYRTRMRNAELSLPGLTAVTVCILLAWSALFAAPAQAGGQQDQRAAMLARAAEAELDTDYVAPPGDPLSHHISGFAKTLCSAVFVTGLEPDFAAESVGFFSGPYEHRRHVTNREVDNDQRRIHLTLPNGVVRTAKLNGDHGCVTLPVGEEDVFFEPIDIRSTPAGSRRPPRGRWVTCCPTRRCPPGSMPTRCSRRSTLPSSRLKG